MISTKAVLFSIIFALVFFEPILFKISVGPITFTILRLLIFMLFIVILYKNVFKVGLSHLQIVKYPLAFIGTWFIYGMFSLGWATDKVTGAKEMYIFSIFLLLIFILLHLFDHDRMIRVVEISYWSMGILILMIAIVEINTGFHLSTSRYVESSMAELNQSIATAFFYNENDLSLFLVMLAPFYLTKIFDRQTLLLKLVSIVLYVALCYVIFVNSSRIAIIATVIQFLIVVLLKVKPAFIRGLLTFIPLLILVISFNINKFISLFVIYDGYGSNFVRLNLILNGLYSVYQSFMLGVGPGNFEKHVSPMFNTNGIVNPHNWWIEILTNYGFIIFCGYLVFFFFMLKKLYEIFKQKNHYSNFALTLFLSQVGFMFASIGPSSLFSFWPMWLMYAIILAFINLHGRKDSYATKEQFLFREIRDNHYNVSEKGGY